jgi:hypothetical protein
MISRGMKRHLAWIAALALAGCGSGENDPGPGGVTMGEARALDEAAEMLDERQVPPEVLQPVAPNRQTPQPDGQAQ